MSDSSPKTLDFYFDYLSPFAYFATLLLPALCRESGVQLRWRPVLFAALLDHWGQRGPAEIPPKAIHTFKLCVRFAALHGIPFRAPRFHPFNPLTALRVSLPEVAGEDQAKVVRSIFEAGWAGGANLGNPTDLEAVVGAVGLDGGRLIERTADPEVKLALRTQTELAIERGVFGIPTMIVDDELFWGVDQLPFLERYLAGNDPLADVELDAILSEGRAAERPGSLRKDE
jgi:2-hydroxychromene-2-carboxylate isomerase